MGESTIYVGFTRKNGKLIVHDYVSLAGVYICFPLHGGEFERTQLLCALATFLPRSCGNGTNRDNPSTRWLPANPRALRIGVVGHSC